LRFIALLSPISQHLVDFSQLSVIVAVFSREENQPYIYVEQPFYRQASTKLVVLEVRMMLPGHSQPEGFAL
jgi:hypothetical protein